MTKCRRLIGVVVSIIFVFSFARPVLSAAPAEIEVTAVYASNESSDVDSRLGFVIGE